MGARVKAFNICSRRFCAPDTPPRRLFHCVLLCFPDSGNLPGDRFWMGRWGCAKRSLLESVACVSSGARPTEEPQATS